MNAQEGENNVNFAGSNLLRARQNNDFTRWCRKSNVLAAPDCFKTYRRGAKSLRRNYLAGLPLSRHSATRSETFASPTHMTVSAPPQ